MTKRNAQGSGTIRKKTITRNGKEYTYWEARLTVGCDPGTGKQVQRSFTGKTQKEVREKMQAAAVAVNTNAYTEPTKLTLGQWLDIWLADYLGGVKPNTASTYQAMINNHIKPALGAVLLTNLHPHTIQQFINGLPLAAASVRLTYRILHAALEKAVKLEYINKNPAGGCELPLLNQKEMHPLADEEVTAILNAARNTSMEQLITVALFTGLRESELLGLTWNSVDFTKGTLTIDKQLSRRHLWQEGGVFSSPKSGKSRILLPASVVMKTLRRQQIKQKEMQLRAGNLWNNEHNLVFTNADGSPIEQTCVGQRFNKIALAAGIDNVHFHDLRHTYAVNAIRAGDDIKTIQSNLGHATAAFTLDKYGHYTESMQQASARRMDNFINNVLNL